MKNTFTKPSKFLRGARLGGMVVLLSAMTALGLGTSAPSASAARQPAADPVPTFYFATNASKVPFWATVQSGAQAAAKLFGARVEFLFTDDATIPQIDANLDTAYLAHPSGLVFSMADFHSEAPILMHFVKENIPMVDINIPPEFGPALLGPVSEASMGIPYLTYIGSSEYLAGQDIGQAAVAAHVQGGVCLLTEAANSALLSRCSGMADTLKKAGLTTYKLITGLAPSTEESTIRDFLLAHTQRLALESMNSVEGPITAQIVQSLHSTDPVYSFDLGATVLQDIKNGTMAAAVDQQEYLQGFYAVEVLSFYLKYGFAPQTNILTGPLLITKANVGAPLKYFPLGVR